MNATLREIESMFRKNPKAKVEMEESYNAVLEIIKKYEGTFVYYSDVTGVKGNFRWQKDDIAK